MRELSSAFQTKLIINDRVDIALLCEADGVHLGQEDIPVSDARGLMGPDAVIGATAKTPQQAALAQSQGADYLGSGAWFPTNTKKMRSPLQRNGIWKSCRPRIFQMWLWAASPPATAGYLWTVKQMVSGVSGGIMGAENIAEEISRLRMALKG